MGQNADVKVAQEGTMLQFALAMSVRTPIPHNLLKLHPPVYIRADLIIVPKNNKLHIHQYMNSCPTPDSTSTVVELTL